MARRSLKVMAISALAVVIVSLFAARICAAQPPAGPATGATHAPALAPAPSAPAVSTSDPNNTGPVPVPVPVNVVPVVVTPGFERVVRYVNKAYILEEPLINQLVYGRNKKTETVGAGQDRVVVNRYARQCRGQQNPVVAWGYISSSGTGVDDLVIAYWPRGADTRVWLLDRGADGSVDTMLVDDSDGSDRAQQERGMQNATVQGTPTFSRQFDARLFALVRRGPATDGAGKALGVRGWPKVELYGYHFNDSDTLGGLRITAMNMDDDQKTATRQFGRADAADQRQMIADYENAMRHLGAALKVFRCQKP